MSEKLKPRSSTRRIDEIDGILKEMLSHQTFSAFAAREPDKAEKLLLWIHETIIDQGMLAQFDRRHLH